MMGCMKFARSESISWMMMLLKRLRSVVEDDMDECTQGQLNKDALRSSVVLL